ncbi:glucose-6-phosphate dehydrogenase [Paenibacillus yanchengensis]|uniref:Glucose-6-phosphate 1-dehydrogenase n=1 Tax=Paenibacillus yanchengensis TaxID=2035833 RepID=A0ABW4YMD4_9BACL
MDAASFILFGATGDLAKRKIFPALYNLYLDQKLPAQFTVFGLGRRQWDDHIFKANVAQSIHSFSRKKVEDPAQLEKFLESFQFCILDANKQEDYVKLRTMIETREQQLGAAPNRMFYLSVGPEFFEMIAEHIDQSGLGSESGWKRFVIEKPFGHDLQSARQLNRKLNETFKEEEIFRIDHYLGKPMVQRLEVLQQKNPVLQALWTNRYIANIQITANETVGVEERSGYYDKTGAVRDMFQNHMLQLLMMLTAHFPNNSTTEAVRFKKKMVMEAVQPLHPHQVSNQVIRGQYNSGSINGEPVTSYREEPGIANDSMNDTFIAAKLEIDDYFWRGVPFYIRTGKRLKEKSTRIVIEFKEPIKQSTGADIPVPNLLVFEIAPDESIFFQLNARDPIYKEQIKPLFLDFQVDSKDLPEAYENLIHDAWHGDATFFAHWDEVELSWKWVQPILDAFAANTVPLHLYEAGSFGPKQSDELLNKDGFHWWFDEPTLEQETLITERNEEKTYV